MIKVFSNLIKLFLVLRERGNWKLISHSRKQLGRFIFCRAGLNQMSPIRAINYWYRLLKGPAVLNWRLDTIGYLFSPEIVSDQAKDHLKSYL